MKIRIPTGAKRAPSDPKDLAKDAVKTWEEEKKLLNSMQAQFEDEFPEAQKFLSGIAEQTDALNDAMEVAKEKVREAEMTVGGFKFTRAFAAAGYDKKTLPRTFGKSSIPGEVFESLLEGGHVAEIKLDKTSVAWAAQNPTLAEELQGSWDDKKEQTPRITPPK